MGEPAPLRAHRVRAAAPPAALPADPAFPQLAIAGDPRLMLKVFRTHLKPVGRRACYIEDCIPFRFRCRQSGSRCVLQYTLRIVDPSTGRRWDQWATGLLYAREGEAVRRWRELQATEPYAEIPERWLTFEPVAFIPDLEMVVEVFPYDPRLPNLSPVMGGALRGIEPLLLARLESTGGGPWHVTERTIEPTRYRTELGAALRYTIWARAARAARTETLRCYVKVYRNERGRETFDLLRSLSERPAHGAGAYAIVGAIAYMSELRTLVLEEAPGAPLQQVLLHLADPAGAVRAVARAAAAFNQDHLGIPRRESVADQLDDLRLASTLVQWACPEASADVTAMTAALAQGLGDVPPAPIHGDLKPDHIFLSGDRVMFIDLDSAVLGDPVRDPAHLFAYIAARVGLDSLSPEQARAAATAFAEEYFRHVPKPWRQRFPLHCAGALIEVASGIFRRQEPQWPEKVTAVIEMARRASSGQIT